MLRTALRPDRSDYTFTLLKSVWDFIHANNRLYRPVQCIMPLLLASFRRYRHHSRDLSRVQYNTTNYKYNGSQSHSPARNLFRLHTHTNQNCTKPEAKPSSNIKSGVFDYNTTVNLNRTLYRHCARVCLDQWRKKELDTEFYDVGL